jgi:hypothetical protein
MEKGKKNMNFPIWKIIFNWWKPKVCYWINDIFWVGLQHELANFKENMEKKWFFFFGGGGVKIDGF